jgi:tripartite ATP-independent transporter DctM subunit
MEWWVAFLLIMGSFFVLVMLAVPIVFAFFAVNVVFVLIIQGEAGLELMVDGVYGGLTVFTLLPITLFILMGEVLFRSGIAFKMIDTIDQWLGNLPGRLSLLAVASGTLLATLSGASIGTTAMLGSALMPTMMERGYKKTMIIGPIVGSGGLAIMIPPSALGVILAVLAQVSIGKLLIAIIIPGVLLALSYVLYIIGRCALDPTLAPRYRKERMPLPERIRQTLIYVVPAATIIFLVIGVVFLGVATPTEAAALGTAGSFVLAFVYRGLSRDVVRKALLSTLRISVMVLVILAAAQTFTQILAFTGSNRYLPQWATSLPLGPLGIIVMMHAVTLILGGPIGGVPLMMITVPVFLPVVKALGYDPIWFCVVLLINVELAQITPPFGILLYVLKGIAPSGTTMGEIVSASWPIILCQLAVMAAIILWAPLAMWLPGQMLR